MEEHTFTQFINIRLQSVGKQIYLLFFGSDRIELFYLIPLLLSIGATVLLDRYLGRAEIWEIIFFNLGISLAVSTISTTILDSVRSILESGIRGVFAFLFWYGSLRCLIVGSCLGIIGGAIASIITVFVRIN